ncbi:MAG: sortase [Defluviitaleaceae bacterium]|nr:sortase [Defluviitaleaceae bacterium]MCL2240325.1 sortase [Defluviitaleaceae bacterium]
MAKRKRKKVITPIYPYDPLENNHDVEGDVAPVAPRKKGAKKGAATKATPKTKAKAATKNTALKIKAAPISKIPPKKKASRGGNAFVACLALLTTACTVVFFVIAAGYMRELNTARGENDALRQMAAAMEAEVVPTYEVLRLSDILHVSAFDLMMSEINPDFVCWIRIEGTRIDYPVVRGRDNEQYLHLTFTGTYNAHGAVFMDYRNIGDFVPHIIIYGHHTRHGNMFSDLHRFLDGDFKRENPIITLIVNDRLVKYEIFSARRTDVNDPAFFLDFGEAGAFHDFVRATGAPPDALQILTLSTCVSAGDDDERVIVQGALRNT